MLYLPVCVKTQKDNDTVYRVVCKNIYAETCRKQNIQPESIYKKVAPLIIMAILAKYTDNIFTC